MRSVSYCSLEKSGEKKGNQMFYRAAAAGLEKLCSGGEIGVYKGFPRPRHLQGKGCNTGLRGQAWRFSLFDPM